MIASGGAASEVYTWEPSNAAIADRYALRPEEVLRFDTNTSPAPPEFLDELLTGPFEPPLNEYPDSEYAALVQAAGRYAGAEPGEVIVGAGADEVLDLVAKAFLPPGGAAVVPVPTYAMFAVLTSQRPARVLTMPRLNGSRGFGLDLERLLPLLPEAQVVWLCSPNNPTGTAEDPAAIEAVLEASVSTAAPALVVVDEAYHEFVGRTVVPLRARYPNLVVVRTVSKAFGLAGLRVGYGIAARETIARLERVRPPGSISTVSAAVAAEALRRPDFARRNVAELAAERERLALQLAAAGWQPYPSTANFLLVRIGEPADAETAAGLLLRAGIVPRTFEAPHPLAGHLRLTVRSRGENDRLLEAITR